MNGREQLTLGSLFDGIGGFPLAAMRCGINPVWASEIERVPIATTKRHFPAMLHLGDVTKIDGANIPPVDIITFGSPCQDLSVAGKGEGLHGARSGLFMEAVRIIREMREATDGRLPTFAVWENVPGAFSSRRRADFRTVLAELAQADVPMPPSGRWASAGMVRGGGADVAWRVLDAQYWGVPQRRKRIFLVADFRGRRAGAVLFKHESMPRDYQPCAKARQGAAAATSSGAGGADRAAIAAGFDVQQVTSPHNHADVRLGAPQPTLCMDGRPHVIYPNIARTLTAEADASPCVDRGQNIVAYPIHDKATRYQGGGADRNNDGSANGLGVGTPGDPCPTITAADRHAVAAFCAGAGAKAGSISYAVDIAPTLRATSGMNQLPTVCIQGTQIGRADKNGPQGAGYAKDVAFTLDTKAPHAVAQVYGIFGFCDYRDADTTKTLLSSDDITTGDLVRQGYIVRRLTPVECERLQGFPDGWTAGHADTQRYRALGNSVAVPCVEMVLAGIMRELEEAQAE